MNLLKKPNIYQIENVKNFHHKFVRFRSTKINFYQNVYTLFRREREMLYNQRQSFGGFR